MKASCGLSTGETLCCLRAILVHWCLSSRRFFFKLRVLRNNYPGTRELKKAPVLSSKKEMKLLKSGYENRQPHLTPWSFTSLVNMSCCWYLGVAQSQSIRTSTVHNSIDPFPSPFYLIKPPFFPIYAGCLTLFNLSMCFNNFLRVKGVKWTVS